MEDRLRLNTLVTSAHITLILAYTATWFLIHNVRQFEGASTPADLGLLACWMFSGGMQDTFLSYMMFFILEDEKAPSIIHDNNCHITYAVLDVVNVKGARSSIFDT